MELIEQIERHPDVKGKRTLGDVANFIRKLAYDTKPWTVLFGNFQEIPKSVISQDELERLGIMVQHHYSYNNYRSNFQEDGVILTDQGDAVAVGRVILGICAGLARNERLVIDAVPTDERKAIDNLYAATVAGDIARSAFLVEKMHRSDLFGSSGNWIPNTQCPALYVMRNVGPEVSAAVALGDIDGFLLGSKVSQWAKRGVRLGQLLKMYYGKGVLYDLSFSGCNRFQMFKSMINPDMLREQVSAFAFVYHSLSKLNLVRLNVTDIQVKGIPEITFKATDDFFPRYTGMDRIKMVVCFVG